MSAAPRFAALAGALRAQEADELRRDRRRRPRFSQGEKSSRVAADYWLEVRTRQRAARAAAEGGWRERRRLYLVAAARWDLLIEEGF